MGADFLKASSKSFEKCWDRGLANLASPNLFVRDPELGTRRFLARPIGSGRLAAGMVMAADLDGTSLRVRSGGAVGADIENLPLPIINRLRNEGAGCAVVTIHVVHELSGVAEVSIR